MRRSPFKREAQVWRALDPIDRAKIRFQFIEALNCDATLPATARCIGTLPVTKYLNNMPGHRLYSCAWPSQETLADDLSCSDRSVRGLIKRLIDGGWFIRFRGKSSVYLANWPRRQRQSAQTEDDVDEVRKYDDAQPEGSCRHDRKNTSAEPLEDPIKQPTYHKTGSERKNASCHAGVGRPLSYACEETQEVGATSAPQNNFAVARPNPTPLRFPQSPATMCRDSSPKRCIQSELVERLQAELGLAPQAAWLAMMDISPGDLRVLESRQRAARLTVEDLAAAVPAKRVA